MLNQVVLDKEIGKAFFFFASVAMKSPRAVKLWDIHSLFMAICEGFGKTRHKTPTKKGPFFWFVFFGPTKKMNKTIGLKGVSPNKGLLEHPTTTIFLSQKRFGHYLFYTQSLSTGEFRKI